VNDIAKLVTQNENRKLEFKQELPSSELRNHNLGNLFKKLQLIEQWGTGYEKISQDMQEYPEIKLEIDDDSTFIQVKFIKSEESNTTQETTQETKALTTREQILKHILNNKNITRDELATIIGVSANAIKQHLANLKKDTILQRIGSTKSGYWKILNDK